MGARLQSKVSSGLAGEKGDEQSHVETNAGPKPKPHPNKMNIDPDAQFTSSPPPPLAGHQVVDPRQVHGHGVAKRGPGSSGGMKRLQRAGILD
jgi:hypothetical protein